MNHCEHGNGHPCQSCEIKSLRSVIEHLEEDRDYYHRWYTNYVEAYYKEKEKNERYEKALNELENAFEDFGKITGDERFDYAVKRMKKKYNL
jgi:hypothetical protein